MRKEVRLQEALFSKEQDGPWERVAIPHTWNAQDGQDGGGDYDRRTSYYRFCLPEAAAGKRQYISFEGANQAASVSCNGQYLGTHKGGATTFRYELTDHLRETGNEIVVSVSNEISSIYPQTADFTFFGGIYRNVTWMETEKTHFALLKDGSSGVFVTPYSTGTVRIDIFLEGMEQESGVSYIISCQILNQENEKVAEQILTSVEDHTAAVLKVKAPHLWQGIEDPYCYQARLLLVEVDAGKNHVLLDEVTENFGFRSYHIDPERGFFLNGKSYPLYGVSRHQDRENMGWAIGEEEHREDMDLICEIGANSIRLAHYPHAQYFLDLCDKRGMAVWAEIPFISDFMEGQEAYDNTMEQLREMIAQNYNHPSVFVWGIANEITMGGTSEALYRNLNDLNALAKKMDPGRLTTAAVVGTVDSDSEYVYITDVLSYNQYFGWYWGKMEDLGVWMDEFHKMNPDTCLGLSEYGAEALLKWHSAEPVNHDYSEEYHALYHEEMLKTFASRPYLWSTYVWNMFDFAADARDEGGCKGRNNKGLITYDRKIKKDAFYVYKAFWSKEPFVHICGRRFAERAPEERSLKVYSNQPEIRLYMNDVLVESRQDEKIFVFENVPFQEGVNRIRVEAGKGGDVKAADEIELRAVAEPNPDYHAPESVTGAGNWFEAETGHYSLQYKISDLLENPETAEVLRRMMGEVPEDHPNAEALQGIYKMLPQIKTLELSFVLNMAEKAIDREYSVEINEALKQIKC